MYYTLPRQIQSRYGFEGCLASLDLNGESPDTTLDALVPSPLVVPGCEGEFNVFRNLTFVANVSCKWLFSNKFHFHYKHYRLNVSESVAFEFGAADGVLIYNFPPDRRPDSKNDVLTFGFITVQKNAVLVRAVSASSTDYLQLELVTYS